MGIRTKLIASLSSILILLTVVLAATFAVMEREAVVQLKRDHLKHVAELVAVLLERSKIENVQSELAALNRKEARLPRFSITWPEDHPSSSNGSADAASGPEDVVSVALPLPFLDDGATKPAALLVTEEAIPSSNAAFLWGVGRHLAHGAVLTAAALLAVAIVCQRLVVRPIGWLVEAADGLAKDGAWEAVQPATRCASDVRWRIR